MKYKARAHVCACVMPEGECHIDGTKGPVVKCDDCQKDTCVSCLRQCDSCFDRFCTNDIVIGKYEHNLCYKCYEYLSKETTLSFTDRCIIR